MEPDLIQLDTLGEQRRSYVRDSVPQSLEQRK